MYHVSKDKRAIKSAELIWEGMEEYLEKKEFKEISISDISKTSTVSRATFYRLFDSPNDVLRYKCDQIINNMIKELQQKTICSNNELIQFFINSWISDGNLAIALTKNNLTYIIYDAHIKQRDSIETFFNRKQLLSKGELDYFISFLSGLIPCAITTWVEHGCTENACQIYNSLKLCTYTFSEILET